ncbi:rRNA (cytidine-2'-O-)-methyltransferase, partial [Campylobacter coli]|nr:rRNA (cytidine-2'-O-)-methyltransferase [Campylobacter coli]
MLYFIPTPIGNLSDISFRALELLKTCDIFFCEDTRVSKSLLSLLSSKFEID